MAEAYGHACDIIHTLSTLPIGKETMMQVDRLVNLLESPNFSYLRLQLLQPKQYPDLIRR